MRLYGVPFTKDGKRYVHVGLRVDGLGDDGVETLWRPFLNRVRESMVNIDWQPSRSGNTEDIRLALALWDRWVVPAFPHTFGRELDRWHVGHGWSDIIGRSTKRTAGVTVLREDMRVCVESVHAAAWSPPGLVMDSWCIEPEVEPASPGSTGSTFEPPWTRLRSQSAGWPPDPAMVPRVQENSGGCATRRRQFPQIVNRAEVPDDRGVWVLFPATSRSAACADPPFLIRADDLATLHVALAAWHRDVLNGSAGGRAFLDFLTALQRSPNVDVFKFGLSDDDGQPKLVDAMPRVRVDFAITINGRRTWVENGTTVGELRPSVGASVYRRGGWAARSLPSVRWSESGFLFGDRAVRMTSTSFWEQRLVTPGDVFWIQ